MVNVVSNVRTCSKCGSDKTCKWRNGLCNTCYFRDYTRIPDYDKVHHLLYREQRLQYDRIWYLEHREQELERRKIWYLEHRDYKKIWRLEHAF